MTESWIINRKLGHNKMPRQCQRMLVSIVRTGALDISQWEPTSMATMERQPLGGPQNLEHNQISLLAALTFALFP